MNPRTRKDLFTASGHWLLSLAYLVVVIGPIVALLSSSGGALPADWLSLIFPQGRRLSLWLQSVGLAAAVAIAGMLLGILIALRLREWRTGPAARLRWLFLILAPIPPYVHAMAWSSLAFKLGTLLDNRGMAELAFRGWTS